MQAFCKVFFVSLLLFQYFKGHLCGGAAVWAIGYRSGAYALNHGLVYSVECKV